MSDAAEKSGVDVSFVNELKAATQHAHKKLEDTPVSLALLSDRVTISDYTTYLKLMYNIVADVEENAYPRFSGTFPCLDKRLKLHLIENDIRFLNVTFPKKINPITNQKQQYSNSFALGMMYVMEGSTLGGRFILKNIEKHLPLNSNEGCSYFAGYQNETGKLWKGFIDDMINYVDSNNKSEIIQGAVFTFDKIQAYFMENER